MNLHYLIFMGKIGFYKTLEISYNYLIFSGKEPNEVKRQLH